MKCALLTICFYLLSIILFGQPSSIRPSKPPLDSSVLDKWPSVENPVLSNDGNFAMFTINNVPAYKKTLVIRSLKNQWKYEVIEGRSASFTEDCRNAIFLNANDSLGIINLNEFQVRFIPAISSFKLSKGKEQWMAFQIKGNKGLATENLSNGVQRTFDNVLDYYFSPNGKVILLKKEEKENIDTTMQFISWVNLTSGKSKKIWKGVQADNFVFNKSDSLLAFLGVKQLVSLKQKENNSIWYYEAGTDEATLLIGNNSKGIDSSLRIDRISYEGFSNDNALLFIRLKEKENLDLNHYNVNVEVWSYFDPKLQSQQKAEINTTSYLAALDIRNVKLTAVLQNVENRIELGKKTNSIGLVTKSKGEGTEWNWNITSQPVYYLFDLKTGKKKQLFASLKKMLIARDLSISPGENYVVCTDHDRRNVYIYDLATDKSHNSSKLITVPEGSRELDEPWSSKSKSFRIAGWLKADKAVLIYDQFDVWQIDPAGIVPPKNITKGYGRKHEIVFRLARSPFPDNPLQDTLLLMSFDRKTKENGFYTQSINSNKDPVLLYKGQYIFDIPDEFWGQPIIKANNENFYLVQRQATSESPNFYWTTDFSFFNSVSDSHPETNFNWHSSQLISFETLDKQKEQGILYKPENFDSTKKYPLIIHYYSKRTQELNMYHEPGSENGFLDIAWFVSNGYLVFTPDIHYKIGEPGESALNSVVGAANYLSTMKWVDSKHIGIQGHSLGGWETNYIVTHTKKFAAACSSSGMSDFVGNYLQFLGGHSNHDWYENRICRIGATLWERQDLYIKNSPIFRVDKITTPLLTIANKGDANVQFVQGLELFLALRRLGKTAWMLQYDGESHGVDGKARIDYIMRTTQFFDHYLKGQPAPVWMVAGIPAKMKGIEHGLSLEPKGVNPGPNLLSPNK